MKSFVPNLIYPVCQGIRVNYLLKTIFILLERGGVY